jgi:isopenicillin N synthase-like dioxygenase
MSIENIPVIDIERLDHSDTLTAIDIACRDWGFFQVVNHGIPADVIDTMSREMRAFFAQPQETKRSISRTEQNPLGFYDRELTKNALDQKEIFDFGQGNGDAIRPQWPKGMPQFRNAVHRYYRHNNRLAHRLLAAISSNLGMSPGFLSRGFGNGHTSFLRLNYYPVVQSAAPGSVPGQLGVGQHTDSGALTILLQDNEPGLEVFRHNEWHLVEPRSDALVVNIGDIVQVWSNDTYFAALHRVIASANRARFSIPFFLNPGYATNYEPVPTMVSSTTPARYQTINWGEFRTRRVQGDYADYGEEVQIKQYRIGA